MEKKDKATPSWLEQAVRRDVPAGANRPRVTVNRVGKPLKGRFYRSAAYDLGWPLPLGIFEPPEQGSEYYVQVMPGLHDIHPTYAVFEPTYLHPIVDPDGNVTLWRYRVESRKEYLVSIEAAIERMQSEWCSVKWNGKAYDAEPAEDMVLTPPWPKEADDPAALIELCVPEDFRVAHADHQILAELRGAPDAGARRSGSDG